MPPPMVGCTGWWVVGWMDGLMGGVMLNHLNSNKSGLNPDISILFENL